VQETVPVKRTTYKVECRTETYDTCRTECVPVCREKVVCCVKKIPVWTEQCVKKCVKVTCYEERMVNKTCYKYVQETCMKKQLVRLGHWECREAHSLFGGGHGGGGLFGGHHGNNCCSDSCGTSCNTGCADNCRPARMKQVWVHCPEYRECPVTVCKKVCYTECVKCKVPVCRTEWREEKVKVCTYQCVTENRVVKYTCYETRQVPCKATRTVRVCVPCEETVNCTRWVQKQAACAPAQTCAPACTTSNACCNNSNACCNSNSCCERGGLFHGMRNRCGHHNRDCCRTTTCCTTTCTTSCCK